MTNDELFDKLNESLLSLEKKIKAMDANLNALLSHSLMLAQRVSRLEDECLRRHGTPPPRDVSSDS